MKTRRWAVRSLGSIAESGEEGANTTAPIAAAFVGRVSLPWALAILVEPPVISLETNVLRVAASGFAFDRFHEAWAIKEWRGWGHHRVRRRFTT